MKYRDRYPADWEEIALKVKQAAKWQCQMCGLGCIPSGVAVAGIGKSARAIYRLEVHHINCKPEDNRKENLIALCSACHLRQRRRGRGSVEFVFVRDKKIRGRSPPTPPQESVNLDLNQT